VSLNPKDFFDPIEGEPLRDLLGALQNANIKSNQREANAKLGEISSLLSRQQAELSRQSNLPPCPYCGGRLEGQYEICKHCRSSISWVEGYPCKPGNEAEFKRQIDEAKKRLREERAKEEERATAESERKAKEFESSYKNLMWIILFICMFILFCISLSQLPTNSTRHTNIHPLKPEATVVKIQDIENKSEPQTVDLNAEKNIESLSYKSETKASNSSTKNNASTASYTISHNAIWVENTRIIEKDFAEELVQLAGQGKSLHMEEIIAMDPSVASVLSNHQGDLYLGGLVDLDDESAKYLSRHKGKVYLVDRLNEILARNSNGILKDKEKESKAALSKTENFNRTPPDSISHNTTDITSPAFIENRKVRDSVYKDKAQAIIEIFGNKWNKPVSYPDRCKWQEAIIRARASQKDFKKLLTYRLGKRNGYLENALMTRKSGEEAGEFIINQILELNNYLGLQKDDFRRLDELPDFS